MDNSEPKVIPVSEQERIEGQEKALEKLSERKPIPQSERPHEIEIDQKLSELLAAFQNGLTVEEACRYADISPATYYRRMNDDEEFAKAINRQKEFVIRRAKERVAQIINHGADREAGPMARWLLERRQPEIYGQPNPFQNPTGNTTNNYYISVRDIRELFRRPDTQPITAQKLSEVLEAQPLTDNGRKEEIAPPVYTDKLQDNNSDQVNLSNPPSTV